jgi:hypothetical protein
MYAQPNTTISVLSSTTTDSRGDVADTAAASAAGVPCALVLGTKRVWLPDSGQTRQITYWTGYVPSTTTVEVGDRVRDETDDQIYVVAGVATPKSSQTTYDTMLDLQQL